MSRPTVLVIDDSATIREELRAHLEAAGYAVVTVGTGEDGLRVAAGLRPSAMIVDGNLPGIDGAAVIRRVRLDTALRRTPCLLLTGGRANRTDELDALDAGADAFVRKAEGVPVVLARLGVMLRSAGAPDEEPGSAPHPGARRVLVVDDNADYADALADELQSEGYEVLVAHRGEEALDRLAAQPVDCVLLDMIMPGLTGEETCRRIKSSPALRNVPLIMLTGLTEHAAMIDAFNAGADDYLPKSTAPEVLRARVRAQIRRKQFADESRRIRDRILHRELEAQEARASRELAEERARHLADLQQKNDELARARDRAERESRFKSRFLAGMSQELRTPMNAIIGFSELLDREVFGPLNPKQGQYVRNVLDRARHLLGIINDVLDVSKIEAGKMALSRTWISLAAAADTVCRAVEPLATKQGVTVGVDVPSDVPAVYADPARLNQILQNLLANGIKLTPSGGSVRLVAWAVGSQACFAVVDTGAGLRPEDVERLFTEFERIEPAAGNQIEGTGLGLALVKLLVDLHEGSIEVESQPGKGTRVTVVLPAPPAEGTPASA